MNPPIIKSDLISDQSKFHKYKAHPYLHIGMIFHIKYLNHKVDFSTCLTIYHKFNNL